MPPPRLAWVFAILLVAPLAWGQDVPSGPPKGKPVPALTVFDTTGPQAGEEVDYAAERKGRPTVYALVQGDKWDRPMARFLKKLDDAVKQEGGDALVVAVWVTREVTKTKSNLPVVQLTLGFEKTVLTCFTGGPEGPGGWGVNAEAHLTAVVAHRGRVAAVFGYRSVNETNVPEVRDALKRARTGK
jgi:hypothetical protein